jgi:hypothetical protein
MHRRDLLRLLSLSTFAGAVGCNGPSDSARPISAPPCPNHRFTSSSVTMTRASRR